jgi:hypothetical protein
MILGFDTTQSCQVDTDPSEEHAAFLHMFIIIIIIVVVVKFPPISY